MQRIINYECFVSRRFYLLDVINSRNTYTVFWINGKSVCVCICSVISAIFHKVYNPGMIGLSIGNCRAVKLFLDGLMIIWSWKGDGSIQYKPSANYFFVNWSKRFANRQNIYCLAEVFNVKLQHRGQPLTIQKSWRRTLKWFDIIRRLHVKTR